MHPSKGMDSRIRKSTIVLLRAVFLFVAVIGATILVYSEGLTANEPADSITLAYVNTTHAVLAGVALRNGYFQEEGLEVTSREHSFGKSAMADMLNGNADFATVADPPIMMEVMRGRKIYVLATIQKSNKDNAIVARRDAGIIDPSGLKGRRIGTTLGTTADFFLEAFLVANSIRRADVEKIDLVPEQLHEAMDNGRVDAVSAFQPFLAELQHKMGAGVVSFYDESIYTWTFSVVARQEYVRKNPRTVEKLLRALVKAEQFVKMNPQEAQKIVAEYSGMPIGLIRDIWPGMRFAVTLDQFLVLALEDESRWAIETEAVDRRKIPNYLEYFYFEGLEAVKPDAVRILGRPKARSQP
jgi:sulfonate transport system substrate-binding protein